MATQENTWNVANRMHSNKDSDNPALNHIITGADEVYDDNKEKNQQAINADVDTALADRYTKAETYNKTQLDNMITTPNQNYVTVANYASLPATGSADTVYRVSNYDGGTSAVDVTKYSEYAWDGSQYVHLDTKTQIGEVFDISAYHATGGTLATYADLSAALDSNNGGGVPQSLQNGGMSIKFVRSSDNKYVQYRYMNETTSGFSTESNWQGVDDEPIARSENLVKSGGVFFNQAKQEIKVVQGNTIYNKIAITLNSGDKYCIGIIPSTDNMLSNDTLNTSYLLSDGTTISNTDIGNVTIPLIKEYTCSVNNVVGIIIARNGNSVLTSGIISFFAIKSEFDNINNYYPIRKYVKVVAGKVINFDMPIFLKADDTYVLDIFGDTTNILDDNKLSIYYVLKDGTEVQNTDAGGVSYTITMPYCNSVKCSVNNVIAIRIKRMNVEHIINSGNIIVNCINKNIIEAGAIDLITALESDLNEKIDKLEDYNASMFVPVLVETITGTGTTVVNQEFSYKRSITILKGQQLHISASRDTETPLINQNDWVNIYGYDSNNNRIVQYQINLVGEHDFTLNQDIFKVEVQRGASGVIQAGNYSITFQAIAPQKTYNKQSIDFLTEDKIVYVNEATGNDDNDGTSSSPFATINKAIDSTNENTIIIFSGDIHQQVNIKRKPTQRLLKIIGNIGTKNRIIVGNKIDSATLVDGQTNIFYAPLTSIVSTNASYKIYQHDVDDINTSVIVSEKLPQQKGKQYRCDSTLISKANTYQDVLSNYANNIYSYFYDSDNSLIYFACPNTDLQNHPIYLPNTSYGIGGNDGTCQIVFENFEVLYGSITATRCHNSIISDCAAKYIWNSGAIIYSNSLDIKFVRCEAARCFSNNQLGDGFNAHSDTPVNKLKKTTAMLVDCWSHDNNDDGYSDHEGCITAVIRGIYEYNGKGGVTPSTGAESYVYEAISRNNYNGFYYINSPLSGEENGMAIFVNCIAKNNSVSGFRVNNDGNKVKCITCKSINNNTGYKCESNCTMHLIDCSSINDSTIKNGDGITIENTVLVTN